MTVDDFLNHVKTNDAPDTQWKVSVQALWYAEKGDWKLAHELSQQGDAKEGAWVHANLHREEGDVANAEYWYSRAGKSASPLDVILERREILRELLKT